MLKYRIPQIVTLTLIRFYSSLPNERYSNGVSPVRFLKNEKKYSVDWKPKKKEISFTD